MKFMKVEENRRGMDNIDISIEDTLEEEKEEMEIMINNNELETDIDVEIAPSLPPETEEEKLKKKEKIKRDEKEYYEFIDWVRGAIVKTKNNVLAGAICLVTAVIVVFMSCVIYDTYIETKNASPSVTVMAEDRFSDIEFTERLQDAIDNNEVSLEGVKFNILDNRLTIIGSLDMYCKDVIWKEYNKDQINEMSDEMIKRLTRDDNGKPGYWYFVIDKSIDSGEVDSNNA